jgi:hypothetical protein
MSAQSLVEAAFGAGVIEAELADNPMILDGLIKRAEEVRDFWVDYWEGFDHPKSKRHVLRSGYVENPGDYSKSIKIKIIGGSVPKARITAHDYKAHWIEYGSSRMPEFAPRAATLAYFGGGTAVS